MRSPASAPEITALTRVTDAIRDAGARPASTSSAHAAQARTCCIAPPSGANSTTRADGPWAGSKKHGGASAAPASAPRARGGQPGDRPKIRERRRDSQPLLSALVKRDRLVIGVVLTRPVELGEGIGNRAQVVLGDAPDLPPEALLLPTPPRDRQAREGEHNQSSIAPHASGRLQNRP